MVVKGRMWFWKIDEPHSTLDHRAEREVLTLLVDLTSAAVRRAVPVTRAPGPRPVVLWRT